MQSILEDDSSLELSIDNETKIELGGAAKWAKIIGYIGLGFVLVVIGLFMYLINRSGQFGKEELNIMLGVFVFVILFAGFILYFLINFGSKAMRGIQLDDISLIESGISSLKTFFIISGVLGLLGLLSNLFNLF